MRLLFSIELSVITVLKYSCPDESIKINSLPFIAEKFRISGYERVYAYARPKFCAPILLEAEEPNSFCELR